MTVIRNRLAPLAAGVLLAVPGRALALGEPSLIRFAPESGAVALAQDGRATALWVDANDYWGVRRAAGDLQADIKRVSGVAPALETAAAVRGPEAVIIGTVGHSRLIDGLAAAGKLDVTAIRGRWESYLIETVEAPLPGVARALVIAGSDKRGTIYGIYTVSEQIGVSPWFWWADVPVLRHAALFAAAGRRVDPGPAVKYRGIFLNDEEPALSGWAHEHFGGFNHKFYEHAFELLLRLKANYLWPAMWNSCFNEDDPLNPKLADAYGIVMGTSHVEPMMRADKEWGRAGHTAAEWNYATHPALLDAFWREGIERTKDYESLITVGMRGKVDTPMASAGGMAANIALLEKVVADQRRIIGEVMHTDPAKVPQVWALYKEVQEYYDDGMRVPDDVTLLWSDDNFGNIRRLPTPEERGRSGGAGIYYHADYVGSPRSYKWLDTVPLTKIWEQMHLAWRYGADRIWILNVGDIKLLELPMEFFLDYAWAPQDWPQSRLADYTRLWAAREFGPAHAAEIAAIVDAYTKLNYRRKPEALAPDTFSLVDYHEAQTVAADWADLAARAERISAELPPEARPAYFQLVLYPVQACAVVNELVITAGLNRLYAVQGRAATNTLSDCARALFKEDADLTRAYNSLEHGRWNHFADQTHLGYTNWQQPVLNAMPAVSEVQLAPAASLAVAVEGSASAWPGDDFPPHAPKLPPIDVYGNQTRTIEVFNRGSAAFAFTAAADEPWLRVAPDHGEVTEQTTVHVSVDWARAPLGRSEGSVVIAGPGGQKIAVAVPVFHPAAPRPEDIDGFVESGGYVSIEAPHFSRAVASDGVNWEILPDFGRTLGGVTPFPVTAASRTPSADSPRLKYRVWFFSTGEIPATLYLAPTQAFIPGHALRCAVSLDDQPPQLVDVSPEGVKGAWEQSVLDGARVVTVPLHVAASGAHTLKFWMVDPGVVLEKIVLNAGGVRPSYLGPPETFHRLPAAADAGAK